MPEHTVIFGNAHREGLPHRGWFVGHFMETDDLQTTDVLEVKWGVHVAEETRSQWSHQSTGDYAIHFDKRTVSAPVSRPRICIN